MIYSSKMYARAGGDKHLGVHLNNGISLAVKIEDSCQAGPSFFSIVQLLKCRFTKCRREYAKTPFALTFILYDLTLRRRNVCLNNPGETTFS